MRSQDEAAALLAAGYDQPPDTVRVSSRLPAIAADLEPGDLAKAIPVIGS